MQMEHREVATLDIPGYFIQADMEGETVHIKMKGKMVDILTKLDIKLYCKYITTDNLRPVLYVDLNKSIYGTIQSALLFWRNLTSRLQ